MDTPRTVLLAVDGSEFSEHAYNWYLKKVKRDNDKLVLVHVTEAPRLPVLSFKSGLGAPTEQWGEIMSKTNEEAEKLEDYCVMTAREQKLNAQFFRVMNESPGPGIVAKAKECGAELIIMGTRGQNKLRRTILGSVSDYVLHHAGMAVAVVPSESKKPAE